MFVVREVEEWKQQQGAVTIILAYMLIQWTCLCSILEPKIPCLFTLFRSVFVYGNHGRLQSIRSSLLHSSMSILFLGLTKLVV